MSRRFSQELSQLIHSMDKDEKRHFSRYASAYVAEGTNYLDLFKALSTEGVTESTEVLKRVPAISVSQLSNTKSYLYTLVLDSLSGTRQQTYAEGKARNLLLNAEILFDKRLTQQASKKLLQARKLATQYDLGKLMGEILVLEETILNETARGKELEAKLEDLFKEGSQLIEQEKRIHGLRHLLNKVSRYFRQSGLLRDKKETEALQELMADPLLISPPAKQGFREQYFRLNIIGMYHLLQRNWEKNFISRQLLTHLFTDYPQMKKEMKKSYISSLNNYILACEFVKNFRELEGAFFQVREMFYDSTNRSNKHLRLRIMGGYSSMLHSCIEFGEFEKGRAIFGEIESVFEELKEQINKSSAVSFYYTFAYIYFGCGDHRKALSRLHPILNDKTLDVRDDILIFAHLFNLIIHFELENDRSMESFIRSTDRFLQGKTTRLRTEQLMKELFSKKLIKTGTKKEEKKVFAEALAQLKEILKDPVEARALEYFDFQSWIESKATGKSFGDCVRKRVSSAR